MMRLKRRDCRLRPLTDWQKVFLNSKVNDAGYTGDNLPAYPWKWPESRWFKERMEILRHREGNK